MLCKYYTQYKCESCKVKQFSQCSDFKKAFGKDMAGPLIPFRYKYHENIPDVAVSSNEDTAKSLAAANSISAKSRVVRLSLNQVITLVIEHMDIPESRSYYLDLSQKPYGEVDKAKQVVMSFVDRLLLGNVKVVIYTAPGIGMRFPNYKYYD